MSIGSKFNVFAISLKIITLIPLYVEDLFDVRTITNGSMENVRRNLNCFDGKKFPSHEVRIFFQSECFNFDDID